MSRLPVTLERAVAIAALAHEGQLDKSGEPYVLHPLAVMGAVSPRARRVAVLHDVLEDTDYEPAALEGALLDWEWEALLLVTRPHEGDARVDPFAAPFAWCAGPLRVSYREFVHRIADAEGRAGEVAREVKRADIAHNAGRLTPELRGMAARYTWAMDELATGPACDECGRMIDATSPRCRLAHRRPYEDAQAEDAAWQERRRLDHEREYGTK